MDVLALKKDPSIETGRWSDARELPGLGDIRLKVKGFTAKSVRDANSARERDLPDTDRIAGAGSRMTEAARDRNGMLMLVDVLEGVDGLTKAGKAMSVAEVKKAILDPAFEPLSSLIMQAAYLVDQSRVAKVEALKGN